MNAHYYIKINGKRIGYSYSGLSKASETQAIGRFIGIAYNISKHALGRIKAGTPETSEYLSMIYGEVDAGGLRALSDAYVAAIKSIEAGLNIRREKVFKDGDGNEVPSVLSGADTQNGVIIIYDAFFKKAQGDEKGLNARSTVILHEIAHLNGLKGDDELNSFESAECLRNLTLLICDIVRPADLFTGGDEEEEEDSKLIGEDGELPNNPNRVPAGTPEGGQFTFADANGDANAGAVPGGEKNNPAAKGGKRLAEEIGKAMGIEKEKEEEIKSITEKGKINEEVKPDGAAADKKAQENFERWKAELREWQKNGEKGPKPTLKTSEEEAQYVKDIREKYQGYSRELTPEKAAEAIKEACDTLAEMTGKGYFNTEDAKDLLFGTACAESDLRGRVQDGKGPALGLFQMEYDTFRGINNNETGKEAISKAVKALEDKFNGGKRIEFEDVMKDDRIAAGLARIKYAQKEEPIPQGNDVKKQAEYWKEHYNTKYGSGKVEDFIDKTNKAGKQSGK